jgi:hypothetical protein
MSGGGPQRAAVPSTPPGPDENDLSSVRNDQRRRG